MNDERIMKFGLSNCMIRDECPKEEDSSHGVLKMNEMITHRISRGLRRKMVQIKHDIGKKIYKNEKDRDRSSK